MRSCEVKEFCEALDVLGSTAFVARVSSVRYYMRGNIYPSYCLHPCLR